MTSVEKLTFIVFVGVAIYIWNKYVITQLIHTVVRKNAQSIWLANTQNTIIKGFQLFYWTGYIMLVLSMLVSD
jgi:hypothetical protein